MAFLSGLAPVPRGATSPPRPDVVRLSQPNFWGDILRQIPGGEQTASVLDEIFPPPRPGSAETDPVYRGKLQRGGGLNHVGYIPTLRDENTLARMIYAESLQIPGDFPAIGWSIVNRVNRAGHQPTLERVLRAPNQFAIVAEGNLEHRDHPLWTQTANPGRLTGVNRERWEQARKVATGILRGQVGDPTGGGTQFFSSADYDPVTQAHAAGTSFPRMLATHTIRPSKYRTAATGPNRQYFFVETQPARPRRGP